MSDLTKIRVGAKALFRYFVKDTKIYAYICGREFKVVGSVIYDAMSGSDLCRYVAEKGEYFKKAYLNWLSYYRGTSSFEGDFILDRETEITVNGKPMTPSEETCLISYLSGKRFSLEVIEQLTVDQVTKMCGVMASERDVLMPTQYSSDDVTNGDRDYASVCGAASRNVFELVNSVGYSGSVLSFVLTARADNSKINIVYNAKSPEYYYAYKRVILYYDNKPPSVSKICSYYKTRTFSLYYWGVDLDYRLLPPREQKYTDVWTNFYSPEQVYHVMDERGKQLLMKHAYWGSYPLVSPDCVYGFMKKDVPRNNQVCFLTDVFRKGHSLYLWLDLGKVFAYKVVNLKSRLVLPQGVLIRLGKFKYDGKMKVRCTDTGEEFIKALHSISFPIHMSNFVQIVNIRVVKPQNYKRVLSILKRDPGADIRSFEVSEDRFSF